MIRSTVLATGLLLSTMLSYANAQTTSRASSDPYYNTTQQASFTELAEKPVASPLKPKTRSFTKANPLTPKAIAKDSNDFQVTKLPKNENAFRPGTFGTKETKQLDELTVQRSKTGGFRSVQLDQPPTKQISTSDTLKPLHVSFSKDEEKKNADSAPTEFNSSKREFQPKQSNTPPSSFQPENSGLMLSEALDEKLDALSGNENENDKKNSLEGERFEPGQVVAIVGGDPIFVGDMLFEVNQLMDRFMPGAPPEIKERDRPIVIRKLVPKFVDQRLLLIDVKQGLPAEANFDDIIEAAVGDFDEKVLPQIIEKAGAKSSIEYDGQLRAMGGSLRRLRLSWAHEQLVQYFVVQKLKIDGHISHPEMLDYYNENKETYFTKAKVIWEELAVRFDKVPNRAEAERAIKKMGNEVVYGASFDAVAKKSSHGFTAAEGGQHDWTTKGSLVYTEIEKQLFSMPINELSDVIQTKDGFHIIRVKERVDEHYVPFLEAQVDISKMLKEQKKTKAFEDHIKKLRERIPYEIVLEGVELPPRE